MSYTTTIRQLDSLKQGLRGDSVSQERVNGLPVKEQMRVETPDGESASEDATRSDGNTTVSRSLSHPAPYRQDKDPEQVSAVRHIIGSVNEINGTDY